MSFPLTYTNEISLYKPIDFNINLFVNKIRSKIPVVYVSGDKIVLNAPLSFSKIPLTVTITINDTELDTLYVKYNISLFENNIILILTIIFAIFFYYFDNNIIGTLSIIIGIVFYLLNTARVSKSIKSIVNELFNGDSEIGEPNLWSKQQEWINDYNVCPACGEKINLYTNKCLNCGLYLSETSKKRYTNINTTGNISYK